MSSSGVGSQKVKAGDIPTTTFGKTGIDLIGIHVLAEHDAHAFDPVQRTHGPSLQLLGWQVPLCQRQHRLPTGVPRVVRPPVFGSERRRAHPELGDQHGAVARAGGV